MAGTSGKEKAGGHKPGPPKEEEEKTASDHLEELIEKMGAFGFFQVFALILTFTPKMFIAWSMLHMSFGATVPDWWCVAPEDRDNVTARTNATFKYCPSAGNASSCVRVYADDMFTIINQFDLQCERNWVASTVTSLQMAGVLLGAVVAGQAADVIGRKKTLYVTLLMHTVFNVIAAFSVNWEMFAAFRFLIGLMIGGFLAVCFPLLIEFAGRKWRPILGALPFWTVGVALFALCAWLLHDIRHLHLTCAGLSAPFLLGWFFQPDSVRWLATRGRLEEAERAMDLIAKVNKRPKPENTAAILKMMADEEAASNARSRTYSYHDLVRGARMVKITVINCFVWFAASFVYYGISFGVQSLSFNLYLNIFLLAVVEVPSTVLTFFMARTIGRRWTLATFFFLSAASSIAVIVCDRVAPEDVRGTAVNVMALIAKLGLGAGWAVMSVVTTECYPTVIRGLAYAAVNTSSRVSGIIAPFVLLVNKDSVYVPYVVVAVLMLLSGCSGLLLKETRDQALPDTLASGSEKKAVLRNNLALTPISDLRPKADPNSKINTKY